MVKHHGACDDRRKQRPDLLDKHAHDHRHNAADDHGAGNGGDAAAGGGDGLHAGDVGEADAQDHRQAGAEPLPDGKQL